MAELSDPRHQEYLEWLCALKKDRVPSTMTALADKLGVNIRTLRDWREKPEFVKAHEELVRRITGSPERTQEVLAALHETAIDRENRAQVQAAKVWLEATGYLQREVAKGHGDTSALSNEELEKLIAKKATELADARGLRAVS